MRYYALLTLEHFMGLEPRELHWNGSKGILRIGSKWLTKSLSSRKSPLTNYMWRTAEISSWSLVNLIYVPVNDFRKLKTPKISTFRRRHKFILQSQKS